MQAGAFCRTIAGNRDDGDDLYQEAAYRAMISFDQLRDQSSFRPWFYRIIVNSHRNRITTPWWRRFRSLGDEAESMASPERLIGPIHARISLDAAMRSLSVRDKALVLLADLDGWSIAELAELAAMSEDAVRARLSRARRKMKKALLKRETTRSEFKTPRVVHEGD